MPKPKPQQMKRPNALRETKDFTDKKQPDILLRLTMEYVADIPTEYELHEKIKKYKSDYGQDGMAGMLLPPVGGKPVKMAAMLLQQIAVLETCEVPEPDDEPYSFLDWRALAVNMPNAFDEITDWVFDLKKRAEEEAKN